MATRNQAQPDFDTSKLCKNCKYKSAKWCYHPNNLQYIDVVTGDKVYRKSTRLMRDPAVGSVYECGREGLLYEPTEDYARLMDSKRITETDGY